VGAHLVGYALNPHWASRLNPTERLVLITMCHTAKDYATKKDPARLYFAGHDYLMIMITGDETKPGTAEHEAARKQIQRAIRGLSAAGAIKVVDGAKRSRNARYEVTPDNYDGTPMSP
jgi:phage terminase large subunit-like protein